MRRWLLMLLVTSIAVNAALGIAALVSGGDLGETQRDVLFTSLCVSGTGVLALACAPAIERRRLGLLPWLGPAAAVGGFGLLVVQIWLDPSGDGLSEAATTLIVVAVVAAHGSLIGLAGLAHRYRWAVAGAVVLAGALGALVISAIWHDWGNEDVFGRTVGVVAVLLAAFTLLVPVLHRASRGALAAASRDAIRFCPRCGRALEGTVGAETACPSCHARFTVQLSEPSAAT